MKKSFLYITAVMLFAVVFLSACSGVKKLPATVAGKSRARFVGTWTLNGVTYDHLLPGSVQTLFNQAPPDAFNGSTWELTNSGNGSYTLAGGAAQKIFWSYANSNGELFQFKQLYQGDAARKVQDGYQLQVGEINDQNMVLKVPVALGNSTGYVVLSFIKTR